MYASNGYLDRKWNTKCLALHFLGETTLTGEMVFCLRSEETREEIRIPVTFEEIKAARI
jgi:hypothetical protein